MIWEESIMSKINEVQQQMMAATKAKDAERKAALSLLLSALKAKAKDKRADLTEEEENAIIQKEIKHIYLLIAVFQISKRIIIHSNYYG
jgi:uncharacterized protein YqeY